jgi:hypothetical protein
MRVAVLILMFAATASAGPVLRVSDLVGHWMVLRACGEGARYFEANGEFYGSCYDGIFTGRWRLPSSAKLIITPGRLGSKNDIVTILKFEALPDRMFLTVRWPDGVTEKWLK